MRNLNEELIVEVIEDEVEIPTAKSPFRKLFETLQLNFISGITVALISIPLSTALAIASGVTPLMGL